MRPTITVKESDTKALPPLPEAGDWLISTIGTLGWVKEVRYGLSPCILLQDINNFTPVEHLIDWEKFGTQWRQFRGTIAIGDK